MSYNVKNFNDWKNSFTTQSVQNDEGTFGSDFLSSESVVLFSGPASLGTTTANMVPIGLVQNVQVQQQKQLNQMFEIGSRKPGMIPGRTIVSGGMARILFDGPSLLYALSIREGGSTSNTVKLNPESGWPTSGGSIQGAADMPTGNLPSSGLGGDQDAYMKSDANDVPSPGYFMINLSSSFFNKPTGLGFALYDMDGEPYGGYYLENVYFQAHTFSVAAQQTVLIENVSFRASSLVPLELDEL